MTIKQVPGNTAPDGSLYITLTDGAGGLVSTPSTLSINVGTSSIGSGTNTRVLYNNAGVVGEYVISGTGNVAMTTSPTFVTPILGTPTSGTLTNCTLPVGGVTGLGTSVGTFLATPTSANLAAAITNETGTGALVFGTSPTITTPNTVGTVTNNNATAGSVGEYISSTVSSGSPVSLTSNTPLTITSISLTAGDWDVSGYIGFIGNSATAVNYVQGSISSFNNSLDTPSIISTSYAGGTPFTQVTSLYHAVPTVRKSLASTTTIYLVAQTGFLVNVNNGFGTISARRMR